MKQRIEWVDAMRGVAMLMVVLFHVSISFKSENVLIGMICARLQLPLFFMISGFFAQRLLEKRFMSTLGRLFMALVIPALLMLLIYCLAKDISYVSSLGKMLKDGYWFTLVLFEFMAIFTISGRVMTRLRLSANVQDWVHMAMGVAMVYVAAFAEHYNGRYPILNVLTVTYFYCYFYFVLGYLLFKRRGKFNLLIFRYLIGGGILFYIAMEFLRRYVGLEFLGKVSALTLVLQTGVGILIIWCAFLQYPGLSSGNPISKFLSLVGRRSIDVYFLHWFLLPWGMDYVGRWFNVGAMPFIEFCLAMIIAVPLTYASLGLGYILRLSPVTSKLLLGQK